MSDNLFSHAEEESRQRLRDAGWKEVAYWDETRWKSPDGELICSEEAALRRLERKEKGEPS